MERYEDIKKKQIYSYKRALEVSNKFIEINPKLTYMSYPLFWLSYDYYRNGKCAEMRIEEKSAIEKNIPSFNIEKKRCFLVWGGVSTILIKTLEERFSAKAIKINMNRRGLNFLLFDTLNISVRNVSHSGKYYIPECTPEDLAKSISIFMENRLGAVERFIEKYTKALTTYNPIFALFDEDRTKYKRAAAVSCRHTGVPSFTLQHGLTPYTSQSGIPYANESFAPLYTDYFLAWGKTTENFMKENGVEKDRVIVCGRPLKTFRCRERKLKRDILVIDQQFLGFDDERELYYDGIKNLLNNSGFSSSIYLRGSYNLNYLKKIGLDKHCIKWSRNGIAKEICSSRAVVSYASTAVIEALELGVPSVSFDYLNRGDVFKMDSSSIVRTCLSAEIPEMAGKVCKRGTPDRDDVLQTIISINGKESAGSVAEAISRVLK